MRILSPRVGGSLRSRRKYLQTLFFSYFFNQLVGSLSLLVIYQPAFPLLVMPHAYPMLFLITFILFECLAVYPIHVCIIAPLGCLPPANDKASFSVRSLCCLAHARTHNQKESMCFVFPPFFVVVLLLWARIGWKKERKTILPDQPDISTISTHTHECPTFKIPISPFDMGG